MASSIIKALSSFQNQSSGNPSSGPDRKKLVKGREGLKKLVKGPYKTIMLEELAAPYLLWTKAGLDMDIASVKGGKITIDPVILTPDTLTGHAKTFGVRCHLPARSVSTWLDVPLQIQILIRVNM
ncbi:unnamed protein product [Calypogeia fissa]